MDDQSLKDEILHHIKDRHIKKCVLATATKEGIPEAAIMGYAIEDDASIILATKRGTRKVKNLRENDQVALIFGTKLNEMNIQCNGTASIIEEGEKEYPKAKELFYAQDPQTLLFKPGETIFIKATINWARLIDYSAHPPTAQEGTL